MKYTNGLLEDGACILKNGHMMKIDEIVKELNTNNKTEYKDHEFCKSVLCGAYTDEKWPKLKETRCVLKGHPHPDCIKTAREFRDWLKENGYKIVKDEEQ